MGLLILMMTSLILKLTTPRDLPKSIDYNLALIIVMALALGIAMIKSGAALTLANLLIAAFMPGASPPLVKTASFLIFTVYYNQGVWSVNS